VTRHDDDILRYGKGKGHPITGHECPDMELYSSTLSLTSPFFCMEVKFGPPRQKDVTRLTSIEIIFFRRTDGYILTTEGIKKFLGELIVELQSCIILYTTVYVCVPFNLQ
jgi:hypothetical protein